MAYKRILTVQDISCLGQCSMTVALPVLSACGHETCILPSKLLSTHTGGFGVPAVQELSSEMGRVLQHWQSQKITFDAVYTGYLGSVAAIQAVEQVLDTMLAAGGVFIADPAMADHGKLYAGLDKSYAEEMLRLCSRADVVLPNLTEAAMMTNLPHPQSTGDVEAILERLEGKTVVLTGVESSPEEIGVAVRSNTGITYYSHKRIARNYHGTGDLYAACFTGAWLRGLSLEEAASLAADMTCRCVETTYEDPAHWYGIRFESVLPELARRLAEK